MSPPGGSPLPAALCPVSILQQQASPGGACLPALLGLRVADPPPVSMLLWIQRELSGAALWTCLRFSVRDLPGQQYSREVSLQRSASRRVCIVVRLKKRKQIQLKAGTTKCLDVIYYLKETDDIFFVHQLTDCRSSIQDLCYSTQAITSFLIHDIDVESSIFPPTFSGAFPWRSSASGH